MVGGEGIEGCVGKETSHFPLVPLPSYNQDGRILNKYCVWRKRGGLVIVLFGILSLIVVYLLSFYVPHSCLCAGDL